MAETRDRRRVARLTVPRHLSGPGLELPLVRLLDLSPGGARIEHPEHLHERLMCYVDLPPALGGSGLLARSSGPDCTKASRPTKGSRGSTTRAVLPSLASRRSSNGS
jgi:hypothetical protein